MDIVFINDLRVETVIGIFAWEREIKQTLRLDLEMGCDIRAAAKSDHIDDTLDYKAISKRIQQVAAACEHQLVEALAEQLATLVLNEFPVIWLRLKLNKLGALRDAKGVGVMIEREQGG